MAGQDQPTTATTDLNAWIMSEENAGIVRAVYEIAAEQERKRTAARVAALEAENQRLRALLPMAQRIVDWYGLASEAYDRKYPQCRWSALSDSEMLDEIVEAFAHDLSPVASEKEA